MSAHPWLALAKDLREFADIEFPKRQDEEKAQTGDLGNSAQSCEQFFHCALLASCLYKHIFI
jgi:hypothetical protein